MPKRITDKTRWILTAVLVVLAAGSAARPALARNVLIFVADGLRYGAVDQASAPAMAAVRREGVDFSDSHSVFPTLTTVNAAALATGLSPGDSGDFANSVFLGEPSLPLALPSLAPFYEDDQVLGAANARFGGDYLGTPSLLATAAAAGFQTAAIGKLGPVAIQDVTARSGRTTLIVDDATGAPDGLPLPRDVVAAMHRAGLEPAAPDRGLNTDPGTDIMAGVQIANVEQQDWFTRVATDVVLPRFAETGRPFVMVFWSRDPDGTQHNQGDSLNALTPGINGPTSAAAVRNADEDLRRLRAALARLRLANDTDIFVVSDHGFSTISKQSATSPAARAHYPDVPSDFLPPGFLALDLGRALRLRVWETSGLDLSVLGHPKGASAVLGDDPHKPQIVVAANGGSDLIWLPHGRRRAWAERIIKAAEAQDYTAGVFTADDLGALPGALPLSAIQMQGAARTPAPDIVVVFRSGATPGCHEGPELCTWEVSDTSLQQGQGNHGGLSRADTRNMMAAVGPDFRRGLRDIAPAGNADVAPTAAAILHLDLPGDKSHRGRVLSEALASFDASPSTAATKVLTSQAAAAGFQTTLRQTSLYGRTYTDALVTASH